MATVTAGSVLIEVQLDTKKARTQLDQFKQKMKDVFGSVQTSVQNVGVQAALVGAHLSASAKQGATANKELLMTLRQVRGGLDGVTNASKRMGTQSRRAYSRTGVGKYNSGLRTQGGLLSTVHTRLLMLSTAVIATFGKAVSITATFENEMRKVKAVVNGTDDDLRTLTVTARDLGRSTTYMATEVARGMKILGQAGFSTQEIKASIGDVLNLARAGSTSLERAAQVMITVGRTFDVEASNMSDVGDILVKVANNSATNIDLLGASFSFVGATAVSTGQKLTGISTLLGVLANRGLRGTKAGTALNEALLRLSQSDTSAKLRKLGISVEDATGRMRPLAEIIFDLKKATDSFSETRQAGVFFDMFGRRGARAGLLIARAGDDVASMTNLLKDFRGEADRTARDMEKDMLSQFRFLSAAVESLANTFIQALSPAILAATEDLKKMTAAADDLITTFPNIATGVAYVGGAFAALAAALVTIKIIVIPLIALVVKLWGVFKKLRTYIGLARNAIATFMAEGVGVGALLQGGLVGAITALGILAAKLVAMDLGVAWDWVMAWKDAEVQQTKYNAALQKTIDLGKLSEKGAADIVQKKVNDLREEGKSTAEVFKELQAMYNATQSGRANIKSRVATGGILPALELKKLETDYQRFGELAKALLKTNGKAISQNAVEQEVIRGEAYAAAEAALKAHHKKLERMEEKHTEALKRLMTTAAEDRQRLQAQRRRKDSPGYAKKRAEWEANMFGYQLLGANSDKNYLQSQMKNGGTEEQYAALEAVNERILSLTKQKARAEQDVVKAVNEQRKRALALRQEKEKAVAKAQKQEAKAREKFDKANETIADLGKRQQEDMQKFLESFTGVQSTAVVTGGGSLSEKLGASDPSITLGKKALREQERQSEKMDKQIKVQESIRDNLLKLNPGFK